MEVSYEMSLVHVKSFQTSQTDIIIHDHIYVVNIKTLPLNYVVSTYIKQIRCAPV